MLPYLTRPEARSRTRRANMHTHQADVGAAHRRGHQAPPADRSSDAAVAKAASGCDAVAMAEDLPWQIDYREVALRSLNGSATDGPSFEAAITERWCDQYQSTTSWFPEIVEITLDSLIYLVDLARRRCSWRKA
jgi:hypothetical protein